MTVHKFFVGSTGPYYYDDTDDIVDRDDDFPDTTQNAITTSGQIYVEEDPSDPNHIVRLKDLDYNVEVFTATGTIAKDTDVVFASGTYDLFLPVLTDGVGAVYRPYEIKNTSTGNIVLKPNATEPTVEIEGEVSQPLRPGYSLTVIATATAWWVI